MVFDYLMHGASTKRECMSVAVQILLMVVAALFEVGGDALIRRGITGGGIALAVVGFVVLGTYGVVVNQIGLDFSRLLGAYVGWFAVVSVLFGRYIFGDRLSTSTVLGVALVLLGSTVIQLGSKSSPTATVSSPAKIAD